MSDVVILVPRRAGVPERDEAWAWILERWRRELPDVPVFIGTHDDEGPFNRSVAVNEAARDAGDWKVAVIADADSFCGTDQVIAAVNTAARTGLMTIAFTRFCYLSQEGSQRVMGGFVGSWERLIHHKFRGGCSSMLAVRRDLWDRVDGFDERFSGWGEEDVAFSIACQTYGPRRTDPGLTKEQLRGAFHRLPGDCWHLWHPTQENADILDKANYKKGPVYAANKALGDRYVAAAHDVAAMDTLIAERSMVPA